MRPAIFVLIPKYKWMHYIIMLYWYHIRHSEIADIIFDKHILNGAKIYMLSQLVCLWECTFLFGQRRVPRQWVARVLFLLIAWSLSGVDYYTKVALAALMHHAFAPCYLENKQQKKKSWQVTITWYRNLYITTGNTSYCIWLAAAQIRPGSST